MSYRTWKKEFYPKDAAVKMSTRQAIEHSLRKWTGLLKENLEKHNMRLDGRDLVDKKTGFYMLTIDGSSCALCRKFINESLPIDRCENCPLYQSLGHRCDAPGAPYGKLFAGYERSNPRPMVKALQKTLERFDAGKLKAKP